MSGYLIMGPDLGLLISSYVHHSLLAHSPNPQLSPVVLLPLESLGNHTPLVPPVAKTTQFKTTVPPKATRWCSASSGQEPVLFSIVILMPVSTRLLLHGCGLATMRITLTFTPSVVGVMRLW